MLTIRLLTDDDLEEMREAHPAAAKWLDDRCLRRETRHLASQRILTAEEYKRLMMLRGAYPEEVERCTPHVIWIRNEPAARA